MAKEYRCVCFDETLRVEAYSFSGILQNFPNHFHEHYVIGFIESGARRFSYKNQTYIINSGDVVLMNPRDSHACEQVDSQRMDYRCINIAPDVLEQAVREITGRAFLPRFSNPVLFRSELTLLLRDLHRSIMREQNGIEKEEQFYFLIEQLLESACEPGVDPAAEEPDGSVKILCEYLERHFSQTVTLDELSALCGWSKYHLLRSFARQMGITPYRYLTTCRISRAKKLLETGASPIEAAMRTGFSDQSHFSKFFKEFIGLTPGQYRKIFASEKQSARENELHK